MLLIDKNTLPLHIKQVCCVYAKHGTCHLNNEKTAYMTYMQEIVPFDMHYARAVQTVKRAI